MRKPFLLVCLCFSLFFFSQTAISKNDSCVDCHRKQQGSKYLGHNYKDWEKSIHAKSGVGCEACHGGNAETPDPVKAHQGVLSSKDKNSKIYFQNVPATCGTCHTEELKEFETSAHYKMLLRTGKGPNCLTCHGAMATTILSYSDWDKTCSLCHGKPTQAAKALSLIRAIKESLGSYQKELALRKGKTPEEFLRRYQEIQRKWHSFDVVFVSSESEKLLKELKNARESLRKP